MVRDTLQRISELLERHNATSNALAIALLGDDKKMWDYLVSNELWGGAGSVADEAVLEFPDARRQLETLLIRLGREQMRLGRVNVRTEMWVTAFEKWQAAGIEKALATSCTRIRRHVNAPRADVYRALLDPRAIAVWKVPDGMTCRVHVFDAREGGFFRISLTYDEPGGAGKTSEHTDTYRGRFVKLVPDEQVVEVMEFETSNHEMRGEMTVTITLTDAGDGTDILAAHDRVPPGVSPADNETGWRMALDKLAALVESGGAARNGRCQE